MTDRFQWRWALLVLAMVVVATADMFTTDTMFLTLVWVPVVASAVLGSPRGTTYLSVLGFLLVLAIGETEHEIGDPEYWLRVGALVLIGATAIYLASAVSNRQQLLWEKALVDPLTGLPNRRWAVAQLNQTLAMRTPFQSVIVLLIEIDHTQRGNFLTGPAPDDDLATKAGRRLRKRLDAEHILARLSDDTFLVISLVTPEIPTLPATGMSDHAEEVVNSRHAEFVDSRQVEEASQDLIRIVRSSLPSEDDMPVEATIGAVIVAEEASPTAQEVLRQAEDEVGGLKVTLPGEHVIERFDETPLG